ncbi:N-acetylmuramoyl-L-alanine amidase [Marinilactibacillus psychrotolerans]|uniref:N-acetylmuramoyl-L-alanine amidase n=1 Tax=Marinilactibacillus psychrotolerans TaxID=191770 RepID=UPI0018677870|nr:N-acetylmuramoyl-L-alanine amidase [Marinilactibacillus psychrotolerans]
MFNVGKCFKKSIIIAGSSLLLASNILPSVSQVVFASAIDDTKVVEASEEELLEPTEVETNNDSNQDNSINIDTGNTLDKQTNEEITENGTSTKEDQQVVQKQENVEEVFVEGKEDSSYDMQTSFKEFLSSYTNLSEDEILANIDAFQLYIDDEKTVHSVIEVLNPSEFGANLNQDLIKTLQQIRIDNTINQEPTASIEDLLTNYSQESVTTSSSIRQTTVERVSGNNRQRVAENVSKRGWSSSSTVFIANGYKFTDALSGLPLAAHFNAPMLLVNDKKIDSETLTEISRLRAKNIVVLGGPDSVSENIIKTLKNKGLSVRRIAGQNRYDTSAKIAQELISLRGASTAHLVNGEAFADAISISTVAGRYKQPILLTEANRLNSEVQKLTSQIKDWRIIGGMNSISTKTEGELKNKVNRATRISGEDRYEVNKKVLNHWGFDTSRLYVGSGESFADVLTGSVLAAKQGTGVLLLSNHSTDINNAKSYSKNKGLDRFIILGGANTLSNKVVDGFKNLYVPDKKVVYIDAGHGGTDTGAVYKGLAEKDLNIAIARNLKSELDATGKFEVVMSRTNDKTLSLANRTNEANSKKADIFVSIHHNAMGGTSAGTARGIETFIHHRVASGFGQETNRNNFKTSDPRIKNSLRMADKIHPRVVSVSGLRNRGIKGNNFHVLRESNMPAVLVEYGFMDNPIEFSIIKRIQYQQAVAKATKDGIQNYFTN